VSSQTESQHHGSRRGQQYIAPLWIVPEPSFRPSHVTVRRMSAGTDAVRRWGIDEHQPARASGGAKAHAPAPVESRPRSQANATAAWLARSRKQPIEARPNGTSTSTLVSWLARPHRVDRLLYVHRPCGDAAAETNGARSGRPIRQFPIRHARTSLFTPGSGERQRQRESRT
jgi:hypothetical protein